MLSPERVETAKLIGRAIGSASGRELLAQNGYRSGSPIVAVEWDTSMEELMRHIRAARPVDQVAVGIRKQDELVWMGVGPSTQADLEDQEAHSSATVGHLYQVISGNRRGLRVKVTNLSSARVLMSA